MSARASSAAPCLLMMPEGLAVGREHQRGARLERRARCRDPLGQAARRRPGRRQRRRSPDNSRSKRKTARLQIAAAAIWNGPAPRVSAAAPPKLPWSVARMMNLIPAAATRRERVVVGGAFGQPHPVRAVAEAEDEILDAPGDLQIAIARRQQRQNRMVVRLRDRVAMPTVSGGDTARRHDASRDRRPCHDVSSHPARVGPKSKLSDS